MKKLSALALAFLLSGCSVSLPFAGPTQKVEYYVLTSPVSAAKEIAPPRIGVMPLSMPGYPSEVVMNYLERDGICIAKSSACKKGGRSHVLEAIGLTPRAIDSALRISFSRFTTMDEVDALCQGLLDAKQELFPTLG